ncbi:hypothetical protein [Bradyrhizobium cenepequi]
MGAKETQAEIRGILGTMFDPELVKSEWSVRAGATDDVYDRTSYAPRLDLAVGPFNLTQENKAADLARIAEFQGHPLVQRLRHEVVQLNNGGFYFNRNPRCLLAIELEYSTSSKHILGGITNASLLGFIGVIVGSRRYIDKIQRIYQYACRLREVEKAHDDMFANIACFQEEDFLRLLASAREGRMKPYRQINQRHL